MLLPRRTPLEMMPLLLPPHLRDMLLERVPPPLWVTVLRLQLEAAALTHPPAPLERRVQDSHRLHRILHRRLLSVILGWLTMVAEEDLSTWSASWAMTGSPPARRPRSA